MQVLENYPLKSLNTFHINAKAKFFLELRTMDDLLILKDLDLFKNEKALILGGGSNILFKSDFDGLIIKNNIKGIEVINETPEDVLIRFGSGENWHQMVLHTIKNGWFGIENLSLIPGTVGAAPIQNIGAYGTELKDVFHKLTAVNLQSFESKTFKNDQCQFGYRNSIFKTKLKNKAFIASVTLKLSKVPRANIQYRALKEYLETNKIQEVHPKVISDAVIAIRKSKLPDPEENGNGGSFFKNPVIPSEEFYKLQARFPDIPSFPDDKNMIKVPAAYLIQECGWKGYRLNDAGVHQKQPLVLVNYGHANGSEIVNLAGKIQQSVQEKFHIRLEPEVNII